MEVFVVFPKGNRLGRIVRFETQSSHGVICSALIPVLSIHSKVAISPENKTVNNCV